MPQSDERRALLRYATKAALGAGIAYAVSQVPTSKFLPAYAQEREAVLVPDALIVPNMDDKYTPNETPAEEFEPTPFQLTPRGKELVVDEANLVFKDPETEGKLITLKDAWDDCTQGRYSGNSNTEWYLALKHDGNRLYTLVDLVSDLEVGKLTADKDRRQYVRLSFDTKNQFKSDPGTPDYYSISFNFISSTELKAGGPGYGIRPPGNLLPSSTFKYNWSITSSHNSSTPHIMIKAAFDLGLLTKYMVEEPYLDGIHIRSGGLDINVNMTLIENIFNLLSTEVVPEFPIPWREIVLAGAVGGAAGALAFHKRRISRRAFLGLVA